MIEKVKLKGPYANEKEFQSALHKEYKKRGWFIYRIPDLGPAYRNYDAVILLPEGKSMHLEYKIIAGETINENKLEDSQHNSFQKLLGLSHECYVLVWSKKLNDYAIIPYQAFMTDLNERGGLKINQYL